MSEYHIARRALRALVSGMQVRDTSRLGWMDGKLHLGCRGMTAEPA